MSQFKGPGSFELKNFVSNKTLIEIHTINGEILRGLILWVDEEHFHLQLENSNTITIFKSFIGYYGKASELQ